MKLMEVYDAQKAFQQKKQRWATSLDELGLKLAGVSFEALAGGWRAVVASKTREGRPCALTIRPDSQILVERD